MLAHHKRPGFEWLGVACEQLDLVFFAKHLWWLRVIAGDRVRAELGHDEGLAEFFVHCVNFVRQAGGATTVDDTVGELIFRLFVFHFRRNLADEQSPAPTGREEQAC